MTLVETFLKLAADARTRTWEIPFDEVPAALVQPNAHVKGAVHLSRGIIQFKIQDHAPDLSTPLVLYCGLGRRSALAADNLQKMGYNNVITIVRGFEAWQKSGLPSENALQSTPH